MRYMNKKKEKIYNPFQKNNLLKMSRINLEDVKAAIRKIDADANVESFRETKIQKVGKAVTSVIETDKGLKIFSKCWNSGIYPQIKRQKTLEEMSSEENGQSLFYYERDLLQVFNNIDKDIAPIMYSASEDQKRIFMEFSGSSLHSKFTDIDRKIYSLNAGKNSAKESPNFRQEIERLNNQKDSWIFFGLDKIHHFQKVCAENSGKFAQMKIKGVDENITDSKLRNYLLRIFRALKKDIRSENDMRKFLSRKGVDIDIYMPELSKYFLNLESGNRELSFIHGDCGPHHIMSSGKIIDFDKFRKDSRYRDLARFLRNPYLSQSEEKISDFLAYFLLKSQADKNEFNGNFGKIPLEQKMDIIGKDNYVKSHIIFNGISMEEEFRIAAVLGKYKQHSKSIKFFAQKNPRYKTRNSLIRWYLRDLYDMIAPYNNISGLNNIARLFEETGLVRRLPKQ